MKIEVPVWEESIIFMPENLLLGLSATIPNARELADWIAEIKGHSVQVVIKKDRAVPLEHFVYHPLTGATNLNHLEQEWRKRRQKDGEVSQRGFTRRREQGISHLSLVNYIAKRRGLPCLYFVFSRQQCELKADELSQSADFLTRSEKKRTEEILERMIRLYNLENWQTIHRLKWIFMKGIAFHHAGLLPALKDH